VTSAASESASGIVLSRERPVLVAVDFSEDSRAALRWAATVAGLSGGRLVVLHVVHDPADRPGYYREGAGSPLQPMERVAERLLDEFLDQARRDDHELSALARAEKMLVNGLPPFRIVEAAQHLNASLIVIGNRGTTGLPRLLQGSVSKRVVVLAEQPVLVVKASTPHKQARPAPGTQAEPAESSMGDTGPQAGASQRDDG